MCNIFHKYIFWTSTTNTLQHLILMLLPSCCHAVTAQHCRRCRCRCRRHRCAAATATMLPRCCCHIATIAMLPPPPRCCLRRCVATKLPSPPLPPCCCHRCRHCQAATATAKLPLLPLSTLWDRFDDEKELCKMTDVDVFWLSWLFWFGIKFLHGGMLSIFNTLVYLSLNRIHLQSCQ